MSSNKSVTHGQYVKIRLIHADPRWCHDKVWPFFAYDWVMKIGILMYNIKCPRVAIQHENRDVPLTKEYVLSDLGLAAFCERCGVPDFFVTLTANDSWPELKKIINGVAPHFRPVETSVLFMQRFSALKPL